jgi:A/G-specific adenine glycosylase
LGTLLQEKQTCKAALHTWFSVTKRSFPWRENPTPYRVWISEIMLQQTRASVVIPYFERWMALFPDIQALAKAPLESVIKAWEGLGYYSRARNIHACAKQIVDDWEGQVPHTKTALQELPGFGPYTIGAVLSFGFHQKAAAVDGNVARVMSRYAWIAERIDRTTTKKKIALATEDFLDEKEPWVTMEALIELGATVCTPKPRCSECSLQSGCEAFRRGSSEALPIQKERAPTQSLRRSVFIIQTGGLVLVKKNASDQLMGDLWEFPYLEGGQKPKSWEGLLLKNGKKLPTLQHSFTRYSATLLPWSFQISKPIPVKGFAWIEMQQLKKLPFSSGHRKILEVLCESFI